MRLLVLLFVLPLLAGVNDEVACNSTLVMQVSQGTDEADEWVGTYDHDCVDLRLGRDDGQGKSGTDNVLAGGGPDTLDGGGYLDGMNGQNGDDSLVGGQGNDILYGGDGDDTVVGGGGHDSLFGGDFSRASDYYGFNWPGPQCEVYPECEEARGDAGDTLDGGDGDDWLWESNSDHVSDDVVDYLDGGPGYDYCAYGPEDVAVNCEWGRLGDLG